MAASVPYRMAHLVDASRSKISALLASSVPPFSPCARRQHRGRWRMDPETHLNVNTDDTVLRRGVGSVELAQGLSRVESSVLGERPWNDLEGVGEALDRVLSQSWRLLSVLCYSLGQLQLRRSGSRHQSRVLDDTLDDVDSVVDRALDVVHLVRRRSANDDRRSPRRLRVLAEHRHTVTTNLDRLDDVALSHLLRGRRTETREGSRSDNATEAAQIELGEDFDDEDVVAVEVVQRELSDGGTSDQDLESRVGDFLEDLRGRRSVSTGRLEVNDGPSPCASPPPWRS